MRADSGFYAHALVKVCRKMDVRYSITIRQHKSLRNLIEAIPEADWTPIPYWMEGAAAVAETEYTPFQGEPDAVPVRLIVRRVKPTPGSQLALFANYSYHAFITDREGDTLDLEADHRRHAEIENAIRDLKYGVGLNHLPSGRFPANAAWLAVQVMAHNLARWTTRLGLGEPVVTTKTLRRRFRSLAGRLTRKARRRTRHLPHRWPWQNQFSSALARLRAPPTPGLTAPSSPDLLTGQPIVPANSHQLGPRGTLPAYRLSIPPPWPPGRHHRANVAASRRPHPHLLESGLARSPSPYPSSLVSTTGTSRFGGFGLNLEDCRSTAYPYRVPQSTR